jgi:flagellar basal-body rod modification protein FlgD
MSSLSNVVTSSSLTSGSSSSTSSSSSSNSSSSASQANSLDNLDLNQFLQLMVTELMNQDPLNPMDNTQLVEQMGQLRSIAASEQLTSTLQAVQTQQSLTTASSLIGKTVTALSSNNGDVTGVVQSVSVQTDPNDNTKRTYTININGEDINLDNVREVDGQAQ